MSMSNLRSNVKFSSKIISFCLIAGVRPASVIASRHQSCSAPISHSDHVSAEERKCLFSPCNDQGALQTFKTVAVQKIVATNKAKRDELKCLLTSHATVNIRQRVETMSRKGERRHWLTLLCPKDR